MNKDYIPKPLRAGLEPVHYDGQHSRLYYGIRDPFNLSDELVAMPADLFYIVQFFDGRHSFAAIRHEYYQKFGRELPPKRLLNLHQKLDDLYLLDNDQSQRKFTDIKTRFRSETVRKPACAGSSYPDNADELMTFYAEYSSRAESTLARKIEQKPAKALVAPHIDPRLGGAIYAQTYGALADGAHRDVFILLGISHQHMQNCFALTYKNFETPLGIVKTDAEIVHQIAGFCDTDFFADEIFHRDEHSIEFQIPALQAYLNHPFQIVPILCNFNHYMSTDYQHQFTQMCGALRTILRQQGRNTCIIAAVDLAHVGPRYGDPFTPDPYILMQVETFDYEILRSLQTGDADTFQTLFVESGNRFHVCGYAALRTLLAVLPSSRGYLLGYDHAIMDDDQSRVTFAGMIFN